MFRRASSIAVIIILFFTAVILIGCRAETVHTPKTVSAWLSKQPIKVGEKTTKKESRTIDNTIGGTYFHGNVEHFYAGSTLMHFAAVEGRIDVMQ